MKSVPAITPTRKFLLAILTLAILSGCIPGNIRQDYVARKVNYIENKAANHDYKSAYSGLVDLYITISTPKAIEAADALIAKHPKLLSAADEVLKEKFENSALRHRTFEELKATNKKYIDAYIHFKGIESDSQADAIGLAVFKASRSKYPLIFPANEITIGLSKAEFLKIIPKTPNRIIPVRIPSTPPTDFLVHEYSFSMPSEYKLPGIQPVWVAFLDDKVVKAGLGNVKNAIYEGYSWYLNEDVKNGRIPRSKALRTLFQKYKEAYGEPNPIMNEYMMFIIMTYKKLESGTLTQSEADYQIAQKQSEISARVQAAQQQAKAQELKQAQVELQRKQLSEQRRAQQQAASAARSQLFMQMGLGLLQYQQNQQLINSINRIGNKPAPGYTIMPYGRGWNVTPR